jgi:stearoyl-CoA desaturase (delta-9 desaturase)
MNKSALSTINWRNFIFFTATFVVAVVGVPAHAYVNGISVSEWALFGFWAIATGLSITVGYHRLFAHRTFKANPVVRFLCIFFGAAAFEESTLQWASQHRAHHQYVDTERDPYNIKQGFFYAHIGWIIFRNHSIDFGTVKDIQKSKLIMHQHRHYIWWAVAAGVLLPALTGALIGKFLGGLLIAVAGRIVFVHHGTFLINSVCHYFGKPTYDINISAKDHWMVALLTNGEGYHSFHHRFPSDYRNGYRWYHWDPSKWVISLMSRVGLARDLKRVSKFHILAARLSAEKASVESYLERQPHSIKQAALEALRARYEQLKQVLHHWESQVREYAALSSELSDRRDALVKAAFKRVRDARLKFLKVRDDWRALIARPIFHLIPDYV